VLNPTVLAGDGVVTRGQAYGIRSIRVDGNDTLAVYSAVHTAREMAITEGRPILIEVHSSSTEILNIRLYRVLSSKPSGYDLPSRPSLDIR
jgi:hypothetical protein